MTQQNDSKSASSGQSGTNYYEILEVSADAPSHEIHRAYQRARETYSQDNPALYSMFSAEEARELLRMIEEAFAVLSNTSLRRSYDESLSRGEGHSSSAPLLEPQASVPSPASSASHTPSAATRIDQLKSEHQALPDFASPADSASEAFSVRKRESAKTELAPGMSKTPVSTYKVDSAFEAEILAATEFDGMLLQRIRVYKNISLDRMSESTRISRPYLTALETNDYKSLPAAVFVRGFVTQVSRNLGIDENKAATTYMKRFKAGGGK